ncbi:MAG: phosphoglycolate phosphatase [Burkholderiales bacterium PBB3]|nr:MAG: phosphoglycolate phosphatase [Burkholderiales bacterium PBB3]
MDLRAAILDLDGTLVHTLGDFVEALQRMLRDLPEPYANFSVNAQSVEPLVGKGSENLIKSVLELVDSAGAATKNVASTADALKADSLFATAFARYQHHYQAINGQFAEVYGGVLDGLLALRALGWPLACVTNKPTAFAEDLLRAKGLDGFFVLTLGGDALARKKPDPLPLLVACQRLGVEPAHTVMIGDSSNDAQAARAAGCPVWLMTYGYNHGQPVREVDADGFVDRLSALPWLR